MQIFLGYMLTYTYLILVLISVSYLQYKMNLKTVTSRKLIHILVGLSWFIMTYYFKTSWHLIIPPFTFIIINYLSYKKDIIKSMKNNTSKGTIYFALSFTILGVISVLKPDFLPFYGIGALSMGVGDGLAPFIGQKFSKWEIKNTEKTYAGSFIIFLSALIIMIGFNSYFYLELEILKIILLSFIAVLLELIGGKFDNITLPIGLSLIAYFVRSI